MTPPWWCATAATNSNGKLVDYAPTAAFTGTETFTYTVSDGSLTVQYSDADVAGENENALTLYYWNEETGEWSNDGITVVERDTANNRLVVTLAHLSECGMFAENSVSYYYFPLIYKGGSQ